MLAIAQLVVPLATPLAPFATFSHTTRVTPAGAVPVILMLDCVVVKDVPVVGVQIDTVVAMAQPVDVVVLPLPLLVVDVVAPPIAHCFAIPGAGSPKTLVVHAVPPVNVL